MNSLAVDGFWYPTGEGSLLKDLQKGGFHIPRKGSLGFLPQI